MGWLLGSGGCPGFFGVSVWEKGTHFALLPTLPRWGRGQGQHGASREDSIAMRESTWMTGY